MELDIRLYRDRVQRAVSRCYIVDGVNDVPLIYLEEEPDGTVRRYTIEVRASVTVMRGART